MLRVEEDDEKDDAVAEDELEDVAADEVEDDDDAEDNDAKGGEDDVPAEEDDPKTGTHRVSEPAQSTCTWTCHKSSRENLQVKCREPAGSQDSDPHFVQACCAGLRSLDMSQEAPYAEF